MKSLAIVLRNAHALIKKFNKSSRAMEKLIALCGKKLISDAQYTSLVSGEDYTTISSILPIIMELTLHLEEMKQIPELSRAASLFLTELKQRFKKFTNHSDAEHDPLFLECSMLDPRYKRTSHFSKNGIATSKRSVR